MLSKHRKLTENFEHFEFGELSDEYLLAKVGFDTAENEPLKVRITDHTFDHILSVL